MHGDSVPVTLLPCPFCGGEAVRHTIGEDEPNNAGGDVIVCIRCQSSSHVEFGRKENLVSRWNTRLTSPAAGDVGEALDQACELIQEAKGLADGENGGPVTDHLDAAEHWIAKAVALASPTTAPCKASGDDGAGEVTLADCPIGLFRCSGELCLKTEYGNNEGRIDAYIVSSGEFFWGPSPNSIANQRSCLVAPVDATALAASRPTDAGAGFGPDSIEHCAQCGDVLPDHFGSCPTRFNQQNTAALATPKSPVDEPWPGYTADQDKRRVVTLAKLGLMLSVMAGGEAPEVTGFDAADLYGEVLMALGIEDADDTDIALQVARDDPEGHMLTGAPKPPVDEAMREAITAYLAAFDAGTGTVYVEPLMRAAIRNLTGDGAGA